MMYLDYNATTPVHPEVLEAMLPYFNEKFGNPASRTHEWGREAEHAVSESRKKLAGLIDIEPKHVVFTSGATESNNLVILGLKKYLKSIGKKKIVTSMFEHKAVLDPCRYLAEEEGFEVIYLSPKPTGYIDISDFESAIDNQTGLVSLMHVNNELGTVQPVEEVGRIARSKGALMHVDGAQAFCKIQTKFNEFADYYSISGHKIYGPKGIGCLFINSRKARTCLNPIIFGGNQEGGLRSGTLPTPLIVGLSKAASVCTEGFKDKSKLRALLNKSFQKFQLDFGAQLNVEIDPVLPTTANFYLPGIKSEAFFLKYKDFGLSNGSACSSSQYQESYVLSSLGLGRERILSSIRLSISPF